MLWDNLFTALELRVGLFALFCREKIICCNVLSFNFEVFLTSSQSAQSSWFIWAWILNVEGAALVAQSLSVIFKSALIMVGFFCQWQRCDPSDPQRDLWDPSKKPQKRDLMRLFTSLFCSLKMCKCLWVLRNKTINPSTCATLVWLQSRLHTPFDVLIPANTGIAYFRVPQAPLSALVWGILGWLDARGRLYLVCSGSSWWVAGWSGSPQNTGSAPLFCFEA